MPVVSFVTQKGGSGKTTLAFSCAVAAEQEGFKVLLIDMDPQGTAESWYQDREASSPQLIRIDSFRLPDALSTARARGFDLVFIDTPGRDEPSVAAAIRASDLCIIPCRPTPADMKATPQTVNTIRRLNKPAAFVLTQTPARSFRIREAEKGLAWLPRYTSWPGTHIRMRKAQVWELRSMSRMAKQPMKFVSCGYG